MTDRVLVVDDDPEIRTLISEALELEGYEVETVPNGAEALEAITRRQPTTMLLDMDMPVLDGRGVASALKQRGVSVPTLVMTAAMNAERWAAEIAAQGWLAKPFNLDELLTAVEQVCPA
jgi:CheY-like chemotaxis protein